MVPEIALSVSAGTLDGDTAPTIDGIATFTLTAPDTVQTIDVQASWDPITGTGTLEAVEPAIISTIQLYHGWNAICLPHDVMMTDVVEGITGDIDGYLYWFDGSIQKYRYYNIVSITGEPEYMSEFDVLPCGENIWIWLHGQEGTVEVTGVPEQKAPFTLVKGWNVIGCTGLEDVPWQHSYPSLMPPMPTTTDTSTG
jgi:hypothetical protein